MKIAAWIIGISGLAIVIGSCVHDYRTSEPEIHEVTITDKDHRPGYYSTDCDTTDGVIRCHQQWHPPTWSAEYEDTERHRMSISSGMYDELVLGERRFVMYRQGNGWYQIRWQEQLLKEKPKSWLER